MDEADLGESAGPGKDPKEVEVELLGRAWNAEASGVSDSGRITDTGHVCRKLNDVRRPGAPIRA